METNINNNLDLINVSDLIFHYLNYIYGFCKC